LPLVDIGSDGKDNGTGGKYLVLPPDYTGEVSSDYIAVRPHTYNTYTLVRSILASNSGNPSEIIRRFCLACSPRVGSIRA
jgi:hypothetical protein